MNKSDRRIKGLGEVSLRVRDLDAMHKFYEEVVGLEVLRRDESLGLKVNVTVHEWLHVWRHGATVLPRPRGESAGVCLLRCKRGIGEMLTCIQKRLDKFCLFCRQPV